MTRASFCPRFNVQKGFMYSWWAQDLLAFPALCLAVILRTFLDVLASEFVLHLLMVSFSPPSFQILSVFITA